MLACKAANIAEAIKLHSLAIKLAERHKNREDHKIVRMAQKERKVAEHQKRLDACMAVQAEINAQRRAEYEADPFAPRNVEWKKWQDKKEKLKTSHRERAKENTKELGRFLYGMSRYAVWTC